jgi:hypothetical protein
MGREFKGLAAIYAGWAGDGRGYPRRLGLPLGGQIAPSKTKQSTFARESIGRERYRFDVVPVGIVNESGIVVRAVVGAQARAAVVASACSDRSGMESVDHLSVVGSEGEVDRRRGRSEDADPEAPRGIADHREILGVAHEPHAKRLKRGQIKSLAPGEIGNVEADMVEHGRPPQHLSKLKEMLLRAYHAHHQNYPCRHLPRRGRGRGCDCRRGRPAAGRHLWEQSRFIAKARATRSSKDVPGRKVVDMG